MKTLKKFTIAALSGTALMVGTAYAADPVLDYSTPGFDWNRYYVGLNSSYINIANTDLWGIGGIVGVNVQDGDFVYGAELEASAIYWNGTNVGGMYDVTGRAGYLVSDDMLLYGLAGIGTTTNSGYGVVGAGLEFAVTSDFTLGAEYNYVFDNNGTLAHEFDAKLRYYFN